MCIEVDKQRKTNNKNSCQGPLFGKWGPPEIQVCLIFNESHNFNSLLHEYCFYYSEMSMLFSKFQILVSSNEHSVVRFNRYFSSFDIFCHLLYSKLTCPSSISTIISNGQPIKKVLFRSRCAVRYCYSSSSSFQPPN